MTPEQKEIVIANMTPGKRKRACLVAAELGLGSDMFWDCMRGGEYAAATQILTHPQDVIKYQRTLNLLADMIWEGGA